MLSYILLSLWTQLSDKAGKRYFKKRENKKPAGWLFYSAVSVCLQLSGPKCVIDKRVMADGDSWWFDS